MSFAGDACGTPTSKRATLIEIYDSVVPPADQRGEEHDQLEEHDNSADRHVRVEGAGPTRR